MGAVLKAQHAGYTELHENPTKGFTFSLTPFGRPSALLLFARTKRKHVI